MDTTSIKHTSFGGTKFWLGLLDDCTDYFISHSLQAKSQVPNKVLDTLQCLKTQNQLTPKYIRCDDAPENHKAEDLCIHSGFNV